MTLTNALLTLLGVVVVIAIWREIRQADRSLELLGQSWQDKQEIDAHRKTNDKGQP